MTEWLITSAAGYAVAGLALVCADEGITLVQVFTDYVVDGHARQSYADIRPPPPRRCHVSNHQSLGINHT